MAGPAGAHRLPGLPVNELSGQLIDLADLFGGAARRLAEQLRETPNRRLRFALMDQFLLRRMAGGPRPSPQVGWVWHRLVTTGGTVPPVHWNHPDRLSGGRGRPSPRTGNWRVSLASSAASALGMSRRENAGGTPGYGTADGAARRTRGSQTGSPPVPAGPLCQHRACGAPAQREASAALAMPVRTRTAGARVRTVRTGSLAPRPAPCHAAAVRAAGCPMRSCIHGKTADVRDGNQNLRSAILRSRRWRGRTVPQSGGCRRCGGWPPPA
jgi:hypothetical protein